MIIGRPLFGTLRSGGKVPIVIVNYRGALRAVYYPVPELESGEELTLAERHGRWRSFVDGTPSHLPSWARIGRGFDREYERSRSKHNPFNAEMRKTSIEIDYSAFRAQNRVPPQPSSTL